MISQALKTSSKTSNSMNISWLELDKNDLFSLSRCIFASIIYVGERKIFAKKISKVVWAKLRERKRTGKGGRGGGRADRIKSPGVSQQ